MTATQRLQVELSELRQKINERLGLAELTTEQRAELATWTTRAQDAETELRAAIVAEGEPETETRNVSDLDGEQRERLELRSSARLTNYLAAFTAGRLPTGPEHELSAAAGVQGIPIELWDVHEQRAADDQRETRAVTPAPGTVGVNLDPIRPAVFANSIAPRLGIDMPRVASGTFATGTISTSQTASARSKGAAQVASAGAIRVQTATPKSVSARLELLIEDVAAVGVDNFEAVLRENMSMALSDGTGHAADHRQRHRAEPGGHPATTDRSACAWRRGGRLR